MNKMKKNILLKNLKIKEEVVSKIGKINKYFKAKWIHIKNNNSQINQSEPKNLSHIKIKSNIFLTILNNLRYKD
jgi:hypothetical protein